MEEKVLRRYALNQTTPEEEAAVVKWLEADPRNKEILSDIYTKMETLLLLEPRIEDLRMESRKIMVTNRRIVQWVAGVAAAVLLCVGVAYMTDLHVRHEFTSQEQTLATLDAPLRYTLTDGTTVWLNSRTTIVFPAAFSGRERTVRVTGEAMFDVVHDEKQPFVVETASCNIRVLGTKFNVIADAKGEVFETALLRGQVEVTNCTTGEQVILDADQSVMLRDGALVRCSVTEPDDYLWTDGFINLKGHTFNALIAKFSQVFSVQIETGDITVADTKFWKGRIRVRDGVDNAMKVLQNAYPISYEFDRERNVISVRNR